MSKIQALRYEKFNKLETIDEQIKALGVVPDFGYQEQTIGDQNLSGWRLLFDYVRKDSKLIKLKNIVYHALHEKNEIAQQQIQSQRQQQLQAHARSSSNRIQLYSPRGGDDKGDDGGMVLNKKIKAIDIIR